MSRFNAFRIDKGYALTEVLVVLILIGLIAAFSVPAVELVFPKVSFDRQISRFETELLRIKQDAVLNGQIIRIEIDNAKNTITIFSDKNERELKISRDIDFYNNTDLSSSSEMVFTAYPDGRLTGPVIRVDGKGNSVSISVSQLTGKLVFD